MRTLVTGGAGNIGSVVVADLIHNGDEVVVIDNLYQGHRAAIHPKATFVEGDLADRELVDRVISDHKPQAILHFASHTLVGESMEKPFLYLGDNVRNGLNLLECAAFHGVERFVLSSTANLFNESDGNPIQADTPVQPCSPYGESKFILERMLYWMDRVYGMKFASLRYFNACGAASPDLGEDHDPETHLIPIVLEVALGQREKLIIFGDDYDTPDGTCIRDYIHLSDLSQAHLLALDKIESGSRTYNLGNGRGFSVKEVVETARKVTGAPIPVEIGPRRLGDPAILIADSKIAQQELGWRPKFTELEQIIESAWQWHRTHPHGYRS